MGFHRRESLRVFEGLRACKACIFLSCGKGVASRWTGRKKRANYLNSQRKLQEYRGLRDSLLRLPTCRFLWTLSLSVGILHLYVAFCLRFLYFRYFSFAECWERRNIGEGIFCRNLWKGMERKGKKYEELDRIVSFLSSSSIYRAIYHPIFKPALNDRPRYILPEDIVFFLRYLKDSSQ